MTETLETLRLDAQQNLEELKGLTSSYRGPCSSCAYGSRRWESSYSRRCHHPIFTRGDFDSESGKISWVYKRQEAMRDDERLCGIQGRLFVQASPALVVWRNTPIWLMIVISVLVFILLFNLVAAYYGG